MRRGFIPILLSLPLLAAQARAESRVLSRWDFDGADPCANAVAGAPACKVEKALAGEGKQGKAMAFADWSTVDYLNPDASVATRLVVESSQASNPVLSPAFPFRVSAWIFPTADPVYYGGIVEKGRGFGGAYRLGLTRGMKVSASVGDKHVTARSQTPIAANQWHEVAMEADGKFLILYVDGKEAARTAIPQGTALGTGFPLFIGDRFTGRIDEIVISTP